MPETHIAPSHLAADRTELVDRFLDDVTALSTGDITRDVLKQISQRLEKLAGHAQLFSFADFPPPPPESPEGTSTRYRLTQEDDTGRPTLYLNSILPGKRTIPHNHGTWAVIVAVSGEEENKLYNKSATPSSDRDKYLNLELDRIVQVRPGTPIAFLPEDFHSIAVHGDTPTLHFHLYGKPLEQLHDRIGVNPDTNEIVYYNQAHFSQANEVSR